MCLSFLFTYLIDRVIIQIRELAVNEEYSDIRFCAKRKAESNATTNNKINYQPQQPAPRLSAFFWSSSQQSFFSLQQSFTSDFSSQQSFFSLQQSFSAAFSSQQASFALQQSFTSAFSSQQDFLSLQQSLTSVFSSQQSFFTSQQLAFSWQQSFVFAFIFVQAVRQQAKIAIAESVFSVFFIVFSLKKISLNLNKKIALKLATSHGLVVSKTGASPLGAACGIGTIKCLTASTSRAFLPHDPLPPATFN